MGLCFYELLLDRIRNLKKHESIGILFRNPYTYVFISCRIRATCSFDDGWKDQEELFSRDSDE